MNNRSLILWQRTEYENTPIYIRPEVPAWFVPNRAADKALSIFLKDNQSNPEIDIILKRLDNRVPLEYQVRSDVLKIESLKECWFHITNRCNMECKHCMFESSPDSSDEITPDECEKAIQEAYELGCRLFYFTGGEPLITDTFYKCIKDILQFPDTSIVILTNLSLISQQKDFFQSFPADRLHFQISIDGMQTNHDSLRGSNAFIQLIDDLNILNELGSPITLSTTVTSCNVHEMKDIIDFASEHGVKNVHFLWLFNKGNADKKLFAGPELIFNNLKAAQIQAEKLGVKIDNIEMLNSQVFSCPGTRYDLSNAGWQSLAIGPDGYVYPTPALVYTDEMKCGHIREGLKQIWENSGILKTVRDTSLNHSEICRANLFRYIIGGGDIDHSYINSGDIIGGDPYVDLYTNIAKWLIARESQNYHTNNQPAIILKMGEKLGECPAEGGVVFFTHSNCVLSVPKYDTRAQIDRFYSGVAENIRDDILNPICYDEEFIGHIPEELRYRSYGCGSPVLEAGIIHGESIVDLGSGTGIECFIASKLTGPGGSVTGIDMGNAMLDLANDAKASIVKNLGYDNIKFKKAYLENLPLEDSSTDLVISNCVLNLSPDKRRVFHEIFRILKPKGRLVISDITYDDNVPLDIKYNETLRGECIGGALNYRDLFGLLNDIGFSNSVILKGYLYRTVKEYDFYSITYRAVRKADGEAPVLYNFPDFDEIISDVATEPSCSCFVTTENKPEKPIMPEKNQRSGCMVCGAGLEYFETNREMKCHYCGRIKPANATCANGHFICDACHQGTAVDIVKQVCLNTKEQDASTLMQAIRAHPHFQLHGPEHHSLVPAVILASLKNAGYNISVEQIVTAIQRGQTIAGGACAFMGVCGAAVGVGIAYSILLEANPYDGTNRQKVQQATLKALETISSYKAPRCCQRDCWLALQEASKILKEELDMVLPVYETIRCDQFTKNKECIFDECPLYKPEKAFLP